MFCNKCGNKVTEGTVFCSNCGNKIINDNNQINPQPIAKSPKKDRVLKVLLLILTLGFITSLVFLFINIFKGDSGNGGANNSFLNGTTWYASDNSEMIFGEDRLYWYKSPYDHNDNYYSGKYKFYIGKEAVDYITNDLSSFGVTKDELDSLFKRNSQYDESNFVVIDINYDKFIRDKEVQKIPKPEVPLYGFILKNNTYLDVANMVTGSYYKFTKK